MDFDLCRYCKEVAQGMKTQSPSKQLDFAMQHLDWLETCNRDSGIIRGLAVNIVSTFAKEPSSPLFNDKRILRACLTVGRLSRHVGLKGVMKQISDRGQFAQVLAFYLHWAEIYGKEKNHDEFESIYHLALERKAQPMDEVDGAFRELRLKYFGSADDSPEENTQMIFGSKVLKASEANIQPAFVGKVLKATEEKAQISFRADAAKDVEQENKENAKVESHLVLGGTSFTQNFYTKAMQDFSNTLPVAAPNGNVRSANNSDLLETDAPLTAPTTLEKFEVYIDEKMEVDQAPAAVHKTVSSSCSMSDQSSAHQQRFSDLMLSKQTSLKGSSGDAGMFKKPELAFNYAHPSSSGEDFSRHQPPQSFGTRLNHPAVLTGGHFLDPVREEVVAGTFVKQGRAGILASTPANPNVPTFEEHMLDFSLQQGCSNNLDLIFPSNVNTVGSEQVTRKEGGEKVDVTNARGKVSLGGSLLNAVSGLKLSSVEDEEEPTGKGLKSLIQSGVNPWDKMVRKNIMASHPLYPTYLHDCQQRMTRLAPGMSTVFEGEHFEVLELIGEGGFAKVFKCDSEDGNTYAVKVEIPSCRWEVYICELLRIRLPAWILAGVMTVHDAYIYSNMSAIVYEYHPYGNLLDLTNSIKAMKGSLSGLMCVYLSWEMARIMREVHKAQIIHADVKPDNFMVLRKLNENSSVDEILDEKSFTIKLIDWGRAIDMSALKGQTFTGRAGTECFDCFEMMDGRPWSYQTDFFGFIATMHVLLFGSYIKTTRNEETKQYSLMSVIKRRCNQRDVLQDVFQMCMNIENCERLPNWSTIIDGLAESVRYSINNDRMEWKTFVRDFNQAISSRVGRK